MIARKNVVSNTRWNITGLVIPTLVAIFTIPPLIRALGHEKFGILAIGWVVITYFAMFDLGLGRATTKFISEYIERKEGVEKTVSLIWNSLLMHMVLGIAGAVILYLVSPYLVNRIFDIPKVYQHETLNAFYLLALSIPFIIGGSCLRGVLEAMHHFDLVNYIKIAGSTLNYMGPLLVVIFSSDLTYIVAFVLVVRIAVFIAYLQICIRVVPGLIRAFRFELLLHKMLLKLGGWITVASLVAPVITFADRFMIAAFFSMEAVTYYVTPYEVVTKLWIFSMGMLGVLFPIFSALSIKRAGEIRLIGKQAFIYLVIMVSPIVLIMLIFGREFLFYWVGEDFAQSSTAVAKWLVVGVFVNVLAQVPYTILQSIGRADITAKIQLIELPSYIAFAWYLLTSFGSVGVAMAWVVRSIIDLVLMMYYANKLLPEAERSQKWRFLPKMSVASMFILASWAIDSIIRFSFLEKFPFFIVIFSVFVFWEWKVLLNDGDREMIRGWLYKKKHARN